MKKKFEYTTLAHRMTARFPVTTYVLTQVNFWIIANMLLVTIIHLQSKVISQSYNIDVTADLGAALWMAVILGIANGVCLGFTGYYQDRNLFRMQSLGRVVVLRTVTSLVVLMLVLALMRYVLFDLLIYPSLPLPGMTLTESSWRYILLAFIIYYFFMSLMINFINQINKKYGPGVLIPLLMGRYRTPREEERMFMFMDLKSSTTFGEKLGHLKYSAFIRDCFSDINKVLYQYRAQVYQYVGDEVVITWPEREGVKQFFCIRFYFACVDQFQARMDYYMSNYGIIPDFKAGLHSGMVTAVEIGELKQEIAYHGDTLNTAARIQGVCNEYGKSFIVSDHLIEKAGLPEGVTAVSLGMVLLKGKQELVGLTSLERL